MFMNNATFVIRKSDWINIYHSFYGLLTAISRQSKCINQETVSQNNNFYGKVRNCLIKITNVHSEKKKNRMLTLFT